MGFFHYITEWEGSENVINRSNLFRFVVLSICSVRRPSVALAQYRDVVALWFSRRALADLRDAQLQDIGLTSEDVQRENKRTFRANRTPWATDVDMRYGKTYLRARPLHQVRSFYWERGRPVISDHP